MPMCCGAAAPPPRVFGTSLDSMIAEDLTDGGIPQVIVDCASYVRQKGLETQGVFRRSANAKKLAETKERYNEGEKVDFDTVGGVHLTANLFKAFFRDLREPLIPFQCHATVLNLMTGGDDDTRKVARTRDMLTTELPARNLMVLRSLTFFMAEVGEKSDMNSMSVANCAIVFGPNLVWPKGGGPHDGKTPRLEDIKPVSDFVEFLIVQRDVVFDGLTKEGYTAGVTL